MTPFRVMMREKPSSWTQSLVLSICAKVEYYAYKVMGADEHNLCVNYGETTAFIRISLLIV